MGRAPDQHSGVPRRENFLQRLLAAAEEESPETLPVADVQELLVLLFELINGREIRHLMFSWKGHWNVSRALAEVETKRSRYRLAQARVDGHLRGLALMLMGAPGSPLQRSEVHASPAELGHRVLAVLEGLVASRPSRSSATAKRLARLLRGVRRLREDQARWLQTGYDFDAALEQWEGLQQRVQPARRRWWNRLQRPGLHIQEDVISVSNERKLALARDFCCFVDELDVRVDERGLLIAGQPMDRSEIRRLGLYLLTLLQDSLDLSDLAVQRAIQAAPAAWLGGLQTGLSADARAGLGAAVVKDVYHDLGRMAERLATQLATLYKLPLDQRLREPLVERYGANAERLEMLATQVSEGSALPIRRVRTPEREQLLRDPRWTLLLKSGERYLA